MNRLTSLFLVAALSCTACRAPSGESPLVRGRELYDLCAQCHGPTGAGSKLLGAPAIAGQHAWYVARQLRKFKDGVRGKHPSDSNGLRMRAMAQSLASDDDVSAIAEYVASLPPRRLDGTLVGGRGETGASLYGPCGTCHGSDGTGNRDKGAPSLVREDDWYLLSQLEKFKARIRGNSPDDAEGALMFPWVQTLADEQAMKDVLAHVETLR
jgi:cytochrome c oxidase subunit 2